MIDSLKGRVALVTGGAQNLGRAAVDEFVRHGASVAIVTRSNVELAEHIAEQHRRSTGVDVRVWQADVGDHRQVANTAIDVADKLGPVSIYVGCAAIRPYEPFEEMTVESWDEVIRTNLSASFYWAKALVPTMASRGWGRIILVSGSDGFMGWANRAHNVVAKAGIHGLSKALAKEFGRRGVTANTIVPGSFDTTRNWKNYPEWTHEERTRQIAVGRLGEPDEFAHACAFLASERSGYITGQAIHLNGGEWMF